MYRRNLTAVATASCRRCYGLSTLATAAKNPFGLRTTTTTAAATFKGRRVLLLLISRIYMRLYKQSFLMWNSKQIFTNAIDTARANLIIPRPLPI